VTGKEKVADFVSERKILAPGFADGLSDHDRSKWNLPRAKQGSIKAVRIHLPNLQAESRSDAGKIAGQFVGEGASISRAFG
jgi:hypothetical protein